MNERLIFRVHAIRRMFERRISEDAVRRILETGEVIESYPEDKPFPSNLLLGWEGSRPIHVVIARDDREKSIIIITAYEPDIAQWYPDFKRRRL